MARPRKDGIDYFPFDTDFFSDKKIRILKSRFGADGILVYIYLLCEIYRQDYYIRLDEDYEFLISDELGMSSDKVKQVLKFLLERSLLESILFQSDTIITSRGIQKRFQEAVKSRASKTAIEVDARYWLLSESETQPFIKCTKNADYSENNEGFSKKNSDCSEKNATKKSKVNKSKEKENKSNVICSELDKPAPRSTGSGILIPLIDKTTYDVPLEKIKEWEETFPAVDVKLQLKRMAAWSDANPRRKKTRMGVERFIVNLLSKEQDRGRDYQKQDQVSFNPEDWMNE